MQKIEDLQEPPIIGQTYWVPCILSKYPVYEQRWFEVDMDMCYDWDYGNPINKYFVYPIINNKHSDKESGQDYEHYHVDYRFIQMANKGVGLWPKTIGNKHTYAPDSRFNMIDNHRDFKFNGWKTDPKIEYHQLICVDQNNLGIGGDYRPSQYKHKCLKNGKCPHRGGNLKQAVPDEDGVITCPLHGLKFYADTGQMTNECMKNIADYHSLHSTKNFWKDKTCA